MTRERVSGAPLPAPPGASLPLPLRVLLWMLRGVRVGELEVSLPGGAVRTFRGVEPGPRGVLQVRDARMAWRVVRGGALGVGEAYLDGLWDSPDLAALLEVLHRNERYYLGPYEKVPLVQAYHRAMHALRANTRRQARRNIAYHYDLGNAFYRLWLDPSLTYSSAIYPSPDATLEEAQREKYRTLLARLGLRAGDHLLEIGSGWGGFALHAARETGCRVTSLTLSLEQLEEARRRAQAAGLADRVSFELRDYRDERAQYDGVVSIEMYEAVGEAFWPDWFAAIARALKPGGRAAIQGITIREDHFERYRRRVDFIQKHVFPGGMLASPTALRDCARAAGLTPHDERFHGEHYAETLKRWHQNVLAARAAIVRMHGERFLRLWRYYLAYCECGFRAGTLDLMQVTLEKQGLGAREE